LNEREARLYGRTALTMRETEVIELVAEGCTDRDIAARLHISEHTVNHHMKRVLLKTGSRSRARAVAVAFRAGVLA
jgi:DNA-binding CsgD family transcriptional regulator